MKYPSSAPLLAALLACATLLTACSSSTATVDQSGDSGQSDSSSAVSLDLSGVDVSGMFTDRDKEIGYDESESALIQLNGTSAQCDSSAVTISGSTVTITDEGTYLLSGTLDHGMVIVDAEKTDKVQLVLNGAAIHSDSSAAIYVKKADKVFLTLATGTENTLSNGGSYTDIDDNNIDAVLFSKSDLTLNGLGALTIQGEQAGHGVVSKDDLVITSGSYTISAAEHGLSGKDSVRIAAGDFTITAGKDGIHGENKDDESLGFLYIADGTFSVNAQGDALSGAVYAQIDGGSLTLTTGGGSGAAVGEDSCKGVKSTGTLYLNGGRFTVDSADDAFHSNASLAVNGGTYQVSTGDDGFHADEMLYLSGGTIDISASYEGLEGKCIELLGGDIRLVASDDGMNAAGGRDQSGFGGRGPDSFSDDDQVYIHISGGTLYVDADGDGIDSNGSLTVSGGQVFVAGPTSGADGALDFDSQGTITGGVVVAAGAAQMAQNFGSDSTQGSMMVNVSTQPAGSAITLTDDSGQTLLTWTCDKSFSNVVISCPQLVQGGSYTLTAGDSATEITMDSLIYGSGGMMGGGKGGMGGGMDGIHGQRPDGADGDLPDGTKPDDMPGDLPDGAKPDGMPEEPPDGTDADGHGDHEGKGDRSEKGDKGGRFQQDGQAPSDGPQRPEDGDLTPPADGQATRNQPGETQQQTTA